MLASRAAPTRKRIAGVAKVCYSGGRRCNVDETTRELVEGAEGRASAATEGPWLYQTTTTRTADDIELTARYVLAEGCSVVAGGPADVWFLERDGRFIAHARQDIPALCAKVREQDAEIARLRGIIAEANADEEDRRLEREASDREGCS